MPATILSNGYTTVNKTDQKKKKNHEETHGASILIREINKEDR